MRKPCLLLVGACTAGPPTVRGNIWGGGGVQLRQMRAGQALPLLRNCEIVLIITYALSRPISRGGALLHPKSLSATHNAKKDPQTKPFAGLISWCIISGSVQKTVQCTVFSDRSPRGECKPHRGAARARPAGDGAPCTSLSAALNAKKDPQVYRLQVLFHGTPSAGAFRKQCSALFSDRSPRGECKPHRGAARVRPAGDGAPCASLSITHNAKKDPQVYRLQVLFHGTPSAGAFRKQCSALFLATEFPRANQHRTVVLVAACGRPPCSRPWCKPKKSPRS